jgi:hypothetical protein
MGGACRAHLERRGEKGEGCRVLIGKPEGKKSLKIRQDNIEMDVKKYGKSF